MDKRYKQLMQQQMIPEKAAAEFYEKLDSRSVKHRSFRLKIAIVAACIALMIPITVFAVNNVFGRASVRVGNLGYYPGRMGYSVKFDNLESFSLKMLSSKVQSISKNTIVCYDSWHDAENEIGIDLLDNSVLNDATTEILPISEFSNKCCRVFYDTAGGSLVYVGIEVNYQRQHMEIAVRARITIDNEELTEKMRDNLLAVTALHKDPVEIKHKEYETKTGIPVILVSYQKNGGKYKNCYNAVFAVDNVSYDVRFWSNNENEAADMDVVFEVLEGFVLN